MAGNQLKRLAALEEQQHTEERKPLDEHDADQLTDDHVLGLATEGLGIGRTLGLSDNGTLRLTFSNSAWCPRYWKRIAERAQALCKERDTILVPAKPDDVRQFIGYIESGVFTVHPQRPQSHYRHESCISINYELAGREYNSPDASALSDLLHRVTNALDCIMFQVQGELCTTTDDVIGVLRWSIGEE